MDRTEFLTLLDDLLELKKGTLHGCEVLAQMEEWDSLAVLGFIALIDEKFSKIVSPAQLRSAQIVNDLFNLTQ